MATIYAYSSNSIYCTYSLSISRSGSTITVKASGTIYGNGSSADSNNSLYAHLRYNVKPANTSDTTKYVSDYGDSFGNGVKIVSAPLNGSSIPTSGKTFSASWTITNNKKVTYNNCALFLSKSRTDVDALGTKAYAFIGKKNSSLSVNELRYYTQDLSIGAAYTACTAPTSVTANANIVKQNDNVTISWSGAKAGTNNAISKYRVFYRKGASPTTSTYDGYKDSADSTSKSVNITMSGTKGSNYYFKVQTIGSVSGYSSGISSAYATSKVNQLPPAPTVTPDKTIVPSSGGEVTFNLSATDPDGQTTSFYYSTSAEETKTKISNGGSISVSNTTTYYFYSYDGLEYSSSYTSKTITKNTKPTISISSQGAGTLYTSDLLTNDSYKNFYTKVTGTATLSKTGSTITWYGRYATIPSSGSVSSWTTVDLGVNNNTTVTHNLSSNDTFKTLSNIVYQIGAKCNDGIEDSNTVWANTNFVIAPNPTIGDFFNQHGTSDKKYSTHRHFYDKASITATKDSSVISITASIDNNATITIPTDSIDTYKTYGYFKINILNTSINTKYKLTFTINRVIGSTKAEFNAKSPGITSAGLPYIGDSIFTSANIDNQTSILKPYTDSGNFIISLYNFFGTLSYDSAKKNYDGTNLPGSCLSFTLIKGSKSLNINPTLDNSSSPDTLRFTYNKNFYKELLLEGSNPLNLNLEDINIVDLKITFTDVFGQSYSVIKSNYLTLDFREPFIKENTGFSVKIIRNGTEITTSNHIMENDTLKFKFEWSAYNNQNAIIESYICRTEEYVTDAKNLTNWVKYQNDSNYIWNINTEGTIENLIRSGTNSKEYNVGRLDKSYYVYFKIVATINGYSNPYYSGSFITQRHIPVPKISFTSVNYGNKYIQTTDTSFNSEKTYYELKNEEYVETTDTSFNSEKTYYELIKIISYTHSNYDTGGGNTPGNLTDTYKGINKIEFGIQYATDFNTENDIKYIGASETEPNKFTALTTITDINKIFAEEKNLTEYTCPFNINSWTYYNIRLVVKTTINSIVKTSYGEEITIYNLAPTVSYRKNQIGINIKPESADRLDKITTGENIKDTGALIIQTTSDKKNIYIISADNVLKIKMTDGSIDGAIIDCGTW